MPNVGIGTATVNAGLHVNKNGAASTPGIQSSGTWFSGGTATTTKPQLLIEPLTGATSTAWSTNGTGLGVNAATGFTGNLIDLQMNGVSRFSVSAAGVLTGNGSGLTGVVATVSSDASNNTKAGTSALAALAAGGLDNSGFGKSALAGVTTGDNNTAVGSSAMAAVSTGVNNVAIGHNAMAASNGSKNVIIGKDAFATGTSGDENVAIGGAALESANGSLGSVAVGYNTTPSGGSYNTAVGYQAGANITSASTNSVFLGINAGPSASSAVNDKLYINNAAGTPLIYGDFATDRVGINMVDPGTAFDVAGAITSRPSGTGTGQTGQIMMRELAASGTNTYTLKAPDALTVDRSLTFPDSNGSSGQVLSTNGSGVLSWVTALTSTTGFVNGGNSFAANATVGTNDAFSLSLKTNNVSRLTIDSAGAMTLNGNADFSVNSGQFLANNSIAVSNPVYSFYNDIDTGVSQLGAAANTLSLITGGTERVKIDTSGYVGIGTSTPAGILDVRGGTAAGSTSGTNINIIAQNSGTGNFNGGSIVLTPGAKSGTGKNGTVRLGYDAGADLGPTGRVPDVIVGNAAEPSLMFQHANTQSALLGFTTGAPNSYFAIASENANLGLQFKVNGSYSSDYLNTATTAMTIINSGNVGIGSTTPASKLDVVGSIRASSGQISAAPYNATAGTSFDFNNGNAQYTTATCQAMTLTNALDGGSYSVAVKSTSGTCSFTHTGLTVKYAGGVSNVTITAHTVFTFLRMGTDLYVTWVSF